MIADRSPSAIAVRQSGVWYVQWLPGGLSSPRLLNNVCSVWKSNRRYDVTQFGSNFSVHLIRFEKSLLCTLESCRPCGLCSHLLCVSMDEFIILLSCVILVAAIALAGGKCRRELNCIVWTWHMASIFVLQIDVKKALIVSWKSWVQNSRNICSTYWL